MDKKPNILYIMCDQYRFDCIAALGNTEVDTPNIDKLVERGITFTNAYSTCPVCVPARYTARTGREPYHTGCYENELPMPMDGLPEKMTERCGEYLATEMKRLGYHTFGIGKFHTVPAYNEDLGFDIQLNTEELWYTPEMRKNDAYANYIAENHPEYDHIEQLHGERTNMYYIPQASPLPPNLTVEAYVADRAVEQIRGTKHKPYFGFISFIGPHPPCAPPIPYNRYYNPDNIRNPIKTDKDIDFMDEQIPWMNHLIWADEMNDFLTRNVKSRYYGEITYIDQCIGKILDAVEVRDDRDNTLICFCSDHGDHLGDHHAWQKESYFEQSCRIPFLLSWPQKWIRRVDCQLVCLTDLFGIATAAAGDCQVRDGYPIMDVLENTAKKREYLFACYGRPGTPLFKAMIRKGPWKYIYMANGGREQLFNLDDDPYEKELRNVKNNEVLGELRGLLTRYCNRNGLMMALDQKNLRKFSFEARSLERIRQFDDSADVSDFNK